jgi:two-component system response regulator AtoC
MKRRVLVVDDDPATRDLLRDKLELSGYQVGLAESAEQALGLLLSLDPSLVITDLHLPQMNGLDLLERIRSETDPASVIVITGHEDMQSAVAAMKSGAFDYVVKPIDLVHLEELVRRCFADRELERRAASMAEEEPPARPRGEVVGVNPRMISVYKMIGVLARNRATVFIRGETGTGKEMIARAIHQNSAHSDEPFIAVNCSALTGTLLESELFGHVRGAFTGAVSARRGFFELAGAGTIFLDEIGNTTPEFQTKLLRVLQERQFYPVGGESPRTTEARVITATNQPLERMVEQGRFREDLYFRLKVVEIQVPPLRERKEDIPLIAEHLLGRIRQEVGVDARHISRAAMDALTGHRWPGNVRELENALTRAAMVARGSSIDVDHLSLGVDPGVPIKEDGRALPTDLSLDSAVAEHVRRVLRTTEGNKSAAARVLGISRSRLARMVQKYELDPG